MLLCSVGAGYVRAQPNLLSFENYTSEQGLSQNSCFSIAQDDLGFMWFGTQDGLNRYDGRSFSVLLPQSARGRKLPSNYISSLFFDPYKKQLWVGTIRGACIYQSAGDSLIRISERYPFAAALETIAIKKIVSFREDEYWIVTYNRGLICLDTKKGSVQSFFDNEQDRNHVNDIVGHKGKIIVALLDALVVMHPVNATYHGALLYKDYRFPEIKSLFSYGDMLWVGSLTEGCYTIREPLESVAGISRLNINALGIGCFAGDATGNVWIGTRGRGIICYDPHTGTLRSAMHNKYDARSLGKDFVLSLFCGRQGIVWCGVSGNGVAKYDPLRYQFGAVSNEPAGSTSLPDNMIFDIYRTTGGTCYIGTQNSGLLEWDRQAHRFYPRAGTEKYGLSNNTIYDMTEDERGNLWIASWGGLMELDPKTKKITYKQGTLPVSKRLYALIKLKNADSLFIASENGPGFFSIKEAAWRPFPDTILRRASLGTGSLLTGRYIYEGADNELWICTGGAGLVRYNYKTQVFEVIDPIKKISIYARHLFPDGDYLWVATDNGIAVYDRRKKQVIKHIVPGPADASRVCYAIQKDKEGFFWVSTNIGLYRIHPRTFEVQKYYNLGNGLSFLEYNTACALTDPDGTLLFGGVGGITFFNPLQLRQNQFSPGPLITSVKVNDRDWQPPGNPALMRALAFNHNQNFLTFYFAVNNFSNEQNNRFSYRLKGLNDHWSTPGPANIASFTSLPPGQYVFELKAANSDGKWSNEVQTLGITIRAPWWQRGWFKTAAVFLLAGLVFFFIRKRERAIKKEATLKQQIAEAEMTALRAQMSPHFVFNSLNSIREMILCNDNKEASHFLGKFAGLIRTTLDQSGKPFVPLRQTMDHLTRYIEMEQIRNGEFTSRILADDDLDPDEVMIPSMLIQPFVENALWHGTSATRKNINIRIDFKKEGEQLLCIVEDDGVGIRQSLKNKVNGSKTHHSVGIENIANRIRLLNEKYALSCSVHIHDKADLDAYAGTGTVVELLLPIK
ncbi:ligand-binding sensor domain-containing protein [Niabella drilacis]|uniref:Two component regulator propeller n=1 Tax=Niabella drilacis (strain DSM 25811 / CCM 8410 / CCUG 62505 / LMG 26954 / E90) TaxID=1285928 RepID=A0A1G7B8E3_NIADE|nr:two-component regulator propeller domain-containing protein [Niabella drilacis]SDE23359.1 Two component regulator propeller [Niabella drilacis]